MNKHITLGIFAALSAVSLYAEPVSPEAALARLQGDSQARRVVGRHASASKLEQVATLPDLYVFSSGRGYMILPSDDVAQPLLAYADEGSFDVEGNPALQWWLSTYADQIEAAKASGSESSQIFRSSRPAIAPLTQTRWNQSAPYNDMTPEIGGKHAVTGCVATAMAQAMKYHNYPAQGTGSHSYDWKTGNETLSFDFGSTTFDWDNMLNTYDDNATAEQREAVATLMSACGVSVDMDYTANESGASSLKIGTSLVDYFGYDQAIWQPQRNYYGLEEWEDLIYSNLAEGLPVLYSGIGSAGGHQFICDGYSADGFFHFNWGWGGLSDGYFQLTALDPASLGIGGGAGGFNSNQMVVLDMRPPVEGSKPVALVYCGGNFETTQTETTLDTPVYFTGGFYNYSISALPTGTEFGVELTPADGSAPQYIHSVTLQSEMAPEYGFSKIGVIFPSDLAEGTYTVKPAYKPADGEWQSMRAPLAANGSLAATVANGNISFAEADAPAIKVTDLQLTSALYWGSEFALSFTATNAGSDEYYGTLVPVLFSTDGETMIAEGNSYPIDIQAGESTSQSYSGTFSAQSAPEAGNYLLVMMSTETGQAVSNAIEVTLNDAPARTVVAVENMQVAEQTQEEITFSLTAECTEGYYAGELTVAIFPANGGRSIATGSTETVYIAEGQSATTEATVNIGEFEYGQYMAAVYKGQTQISDAVYFNIEADQTSINEVDAANADGPIYDLQGRRILSANPTGLFIQGHSLKVR